VTLLDPTLTSLLYLAAAVFFILALKGLNSPRTARRGNLVGAFGALLAVVTVFFSVRPAGEDDPDAAARGPLQRRGRRRRGARGAA
jgi:NAD/NADP transhydrogenase beta subunit